MVGLLTGAGSRARDISSTNVHCKILHDALWTDLAVWLHQAVSGSCGVPAWLALGLSLTWLVELVRLTIAVLSPLPTGCRATGALRGPGFRLPAMGPALLTSFAIPLFWAVLHLRLEA